MNAPNVQPADETHLAQAGRILRDGGLVAFPTETVYGLGADATNDEAVARIFAAKDRPSFNPLIVHVRDAGEASGYVAMNEDARALADRFWPGPLSMVLPRHADCSLSLLVSAGLETVAVRVPRGNVAQALIAATARPIAAPSANRSGAVSPTTAAHVADSLGDAVDMILDGGPCPVGLESTVVDLSHGTPTLLRPGGLPLGDIEAVIGPLRRAGRDAAIKSPGMLERHYAPGRPLRLDATDVLSGEALLAFGANPPTGAAVILNLSPRGDTAEAAANLFAMLRALDRPDVAAIAVMPVPETGLGLAINDRLRRAATPGN